LVGRASDMDTEGHWFESIVAHLNGLEPASILQREDVGVGSTCRTNWSTVSDSIRTAITD